MALSNDQVSALDAALAAFEQASAEARRLVSEGSSLFSRIIGADSTQAALESNAKAAEQLTATMRAKRDRLIADPAAGESQVREYLSALAATDNTAAKEAAKLLKPSTAVATVAKDSAADLVTLGKLAVPALVVVGIAVLVLRFGGRR